MKRLLPVLVGFVVLLLSSTEGWSADFQKGLAAAQRGDFVTALREWKPLAEQGDARAQYNLGQMYRQGLGVPQDYKTAVKWYRLAAEQGDADAQYNLGFMYHEGKGVIQDNVYALIWWNVAASQGVRNATKNRDILAKKMTPADISKAQRLAQKCAKKSYKGC